MKQGFIDKLFYIIFIALWVTASQSADATERQNHIKLVDGLLPPWTFINEKNGETEDRGIVYDIGRELADALDMELIYQVLPFARVQSYKKKGHTDLNFSIPNPKVADYVTNIYPILSRVEFVIWSLKDTPVSLENLQETKRIGFINGSIPMFKPWFDKQNIRFSATEVSDHQTLLSMLRKRRVSAAVFSDISFRYENRLLGFNLGDYAKPVTIFKTPWLISVSKKSPLYSDEFVETLTRVAKKLKQDHTVTTLIDSYIE